MMKAESRESAGRKRLLTPELIKEIYQAFSDGNNNNTVCGLVGISTSSFYQWLKDAEEFSKTYHEGQILDYSQEKLLEFLEAVKKGKAEAKRSKIACIQQAATDGQWQAAAWWLERCFPDEYGRKVRLDTNQKIDVKGELNLGYKEVPQEIAKEVGRKLALKESEDEDT